MCIRDSSIDAFVSGLCISFLDLGILKIIIIIGIITLLFSLTGVVIGKILGYLLKKYAELAGGIILIVIAFQLLSGYIRGCRAVSYTHLDVYKRQGCNG